MQTRPMRTCLTPFSFVHHHVFVFSLSLDLRVMSTHVKCPQKENVSLKKKEHVYEKRLNGFVQQRRTRFHTDAGRTGSSLDEGDMHGDT